jgi:tetratricopeptide (TPR) repeat protein
MSLFVDCSILLSLFAGLSWWHITFWKLIYGHILANLIMAWTLLRLLPRKYQQHVLGSIIFFFLLGFFMPVFGNIGLFIALFFGIWKQKNVHKGNKVWRLTGRALIPNRAPNIYKKLTFSAHGMLSRLQRSGNLKAHLGIVLATRFMREENAVPLLNLALRNPHDDVRLIAFTLLEKKNANINADIERLQKSLNQDEKSSKIHIAIARNYLRLVLLNLIQAEMRDQALDIAYQHLDQALNEDSSDRNGHFILGQILLEQGQVAKAESAFNRALELGFAPSNIYYFLAQIAYQRRQFHMLKEYLSKIPIEYRRYPPLDKIAAYWLRDKKIDLNCSSNVMT